MLPKMARKDDKVRAQGWGRILCSSSLSRKLSFREDGVPDVCDAKQGRPQRSDRNLARAYGTVSLGQPIIRDVS
jgi:hypothetical protein